MLNETLHDETKAIIEKASRVVNKDGQIISHRDQYAIDILALSRDAVRRVDADYAEKVKPINEQLAPYNADRSSLKKTLTAVADSMEAALLAKLGEHGELPEETDAGTTLHITRRPKLVIVDADKVPDEFLLPRAASLDIAEITVILTKERMVNKTRVEQGMEPLPYSIPGVTLEEVIGFSTKLSEVYTE